MEINVLLTVSFEKWLKTLGYAPNTVYLSVRYITDFFFYLKSIDITDLEQIQPVTLKSYYKYLQTRANKRQPGSLSNNYITSNINAIKRFSRYLEETERPYFEISIKTTTDKETVKTILTHQEIQALYKACGNDMLGLRDRAILGIYYGCGLRRSEGVNLDVKDVMMKEKLVFVRNGKGYKERYVPMTESVKEDLENYFYQSATLSLGSFGLNREAFFISYRAKRMDGGTIIERVQQLACRAGITKNIGLHTLRHSIATHLLQMGMTLEEVSQFLGHSSLESTQIYTHLANG